MQSIEVEVITEKIPSSALVEAVGDFECECQSMMEAIEATETVSTEEREYVLDTLNCIRKRMETMQRMLKK